MNDRLALGTAQFGMPYGVANLLGKVDKSEIRKILKFARSEGVDTLDTAISYGESERNIGSVGVAQWKVITKLPAVPMEATDVRKWVSDSVDGALERLGIKKLYGLLLHDSQSLHGKKGNELYQALMMLKEKNKVGKIGVSIYDPDELDMIWANYAIDIVQAPFNIIDRRLLVSGWLHRLQKAGIEVHVRSVFLQGLLLMDKSNRPASFNRWDKLWKQWHEWLSTESITPLQACLGYVYSRPEISRIVVGVDSLAQIHEILADENFHTIKPPEYLMNLDLDLINPSCWGAT